MSTLTISLPTLSGVSEFDARVILAGELYERGKVTLGQAAEIAGLSKGTFIEVMGKYGFSFLNASDEDYLADFPKA